MAPLQVIALSLVAVTGTIVVLIGEPLRQALVLGLYGLVLTVLFFISKPRTWRCRRSSSRRSDCR